MSLPKKEIVKCSKCGECFDSQKPHYQDVYEGSAYMAWVPVCLKCGKGMNLREVESEIYDD